MNTRSHRRLTTRMYLALVVMHTVQGFLAGGCTAPQKETSVDAGHQNPGGQNTGGIGSSGTGGNSSGGNTSDGTAGKTRIETGSGSSGSGGASTGSGGTTGSSGSGGSSGDAGGAGNNGTDGGSGTTGCSGLAGAGDSGIPAVLVAVAVHRPKPVTCAPSTDPNTTCQSDADCDFGNNSHCTSAHQCSYDACTTDDDCAAGAVCGCEAQNLPSPGNRCLMGNCRVDADCASGELCSPTDLTTYRVLKPYYCHTPCDRCYDDSDCPAGKHCNYDFDAAVWVCNAKPPLP